MIETLKVLAQLFDGIEVKMYADGSGHLEDMDDNDEQASWGTLEEMETELVKLAGEKLKEEFPNGVKLSAEGEKRNSSTFHKIVYTVSGWRKDGYVLVKHPPLISKGFPYGDLEAAQPQAEFKKGDKVVINRPTDPCNGETAQVTRDMDSDGDYYVTAVCGRSLYIKGYNLKRDNTQLQEAAKLIAKELVKQGHINKEGWVDNLLNSLTFK